MTTGSLDPFKKSSPIRTFIVLPAALEIEELSQANTGVNSLVLVTHILGLGPSG